MAVNAADLVDALAEEFVSLEEVCDQLDDNEWDLPTGCPGWSVKDNLSHVVGLEEQLAGRPIPEVTLPELAHVANDIARHIERPIEHRRGWPPRRVLEEYRAIVRERLQALRALVSEQGDDAQGPSLFGPPAPLQRLLPIRIFDIYSHEQDIRRATGRPGHLQGAAVDVSLRVIKRGLGSKIGEHGVPAGEAIEIEVISPQPRRLRIISSDSRQISDRGAPPVAVLRMDCADLIARACGRRDGSGALLGQVQGQGDPSIVSRVAEAMSVTP